MMTPNDTPSENPHTVGRSARPFGQHLWWCFFVAGSAMAMASVVGIVIGSYILALWAILSFGIGMLGLLLGWVLLLIKLIRRTKPRPWPTRLFLATAAYVGVILAAYVFVWLPMRALMDDDFISSATPAQMKSVFHRSLLFSLGPHDEFIDLGRIGDRDSVPYIIWALRWMPEEIGADCTWDHGLEALTEITNNAPGRTRQAWAEWYAKNKNRSQAEWWADGFAAEGYAVSAQGGEPTIHSLLGVLGRTPWKQRESKEWLSDNAGRMLDRLDKTQVRHVIDEVLPNGTIAEKRGLARYTSVMDPAESQPILRQLEKDDDESVRQWAREMLNRQPSSWRAIPPRVAGTGG